MTLLFQNLLIIITMDLFFLSSSVPVDFDDSFEFVPEFVPDFVPEFEPEFVPNFVPEFIPHFEPMPCDPHPCPTPNCLSNYTLVTDPSGCRCPRCVCYLPFCPYIFCGNDNMVIPPCGCAYCVAPTTKANNVELENSTTSSILESSSNAATSNDVEVNNNNNNNFNNNNNNRRTTRIPRK